MANNVFKPKVLYAILHKGVHGPSWIELELGRISFHLAQSTQVEKALIQPNPAHKNCKRKVIRNFA